MEIKKEEKQEISKSFGIFNMRTSLSWRRWLLGKLWVRLKTNYQIAMITMMIQIEIKLLR